MALLPRRQRGKEEVEMAQCTVDGITYNYCVVFENYAEIVGEIGGIAIEVRTSGELNSVFTGWESGEVYWESCI